jgi:hypothetical protein
MLINDIVAAVGGELGLFLGLSLISCLQGLERLVKLLAASMRPR